MFQIKMCISFFDFLEDSPHWPVELTLTTDCYVFQVMVRRRPNLKLRVIHWKICLEEKYWKYNCMYL